MPVTLPPRRPCATTLGGKRVMVDGVSYTLAQVAARLGIPVGSGLYNLVRRARKHPPVTWAKLERKP